MVHLPASELSKRAELTKHSADYMVSHLAESEAEERWRKNFARRQAECVGLAAEAGRRVETLERKLLVQMEQLETAIAASRSPWVYGALAGMGSNGNGATGRRGTRKAAD